MRFILSVLVLLPALASATTWNPQTCKARVAAIQEALDMANFQLGAGAGSMVAVDYATMRLNNAKLDCGEMDKTQFCKDTVPVATAYKDLARHDLSYDSSDDSVATYLRSLDAYFEVLNACE